jgi:hypothetical protein
VTAPRPAASGQQQDRRQAADEARWAAIRERVRQEVATWPPLTDEQREQLRELFDLSDDGTGHDTA